MPNAVNLPLLSDEERNLVGKAYKEGGQTSAIAKGLQLIPEEAREQLIEKWIEFLEQRPNALICCWRGGLRSKVVQTWLLEAGWNVPRVAGGSKALRFFCMQTNDVATHYHYVVLAGRTGSGKTQLINELQPSIDLEGLARHRGSAFGGDTATQPVPVGFENALATDLLKLENATRILVEDESRVIGKLAIPEGIFRKMGQSPVVVLRAENAARIRHIYESYVRGTSPSAMLINLEKIRKRLGLKRYGQIRRALKNAYETNEYEAHCTWLQLLLSFYYDPMYDYQLDRKLARVVFTGSKLKVKEILMREFGFTPKRSTR